ncbi:type II toxin-antitoxin system Phd/YefM family antitoxin [Terriglobus sp.]|uniref:type II toxin-antitoxin system Phd/YefM family antitoxin n=1 Tax=Terriglobus sp. TaxID=1889013 RepID=UPI003AFF9559
MGAYQIKQHDTELAELLNCAEAGEEIALEKDGAIVAKIIPFRAPETDDRPVRRRGGQNASGLAGADLSWLDEPWPEDIQRAFGMID